MRKSSVLPSPRSIMPGEIGVSSIAWPEVLQRVPVRLPQRSIRVIPLLV